MTHSIGSSSRAVKQLEGWVNANVDVRKYLKKPSGYEGLPESARKDAQLKDRTQAAERIVKQHLTNREFASIMNQLSDPKSSSGNAVFCSAVREVLKEIQEKEWSQYDHPSNARSRQRTNDRKLVNA